MSAGGVFHYLNHADNGLYPINSVEPEITVKITTVDYKDIFIHSDHVKFLKNIGGFFLFQNMSERGFEDIIKKDSDNSIKLLRHEGNKINAFKFSDLKVKKTLTFGDYEKNVMLCSHVKKMSEDKNSKLNLLICNVSFAQPVVPNAAITESDSTKEENDKMLAITNFKSNYNKQKMTLTKFANDAKNYGCENDVDAVILGGNFNSNVNSDVAIKALTSLESYNKVKLFSSDLGKLGYRELFGSSENRFFIYTSGYQKYNLVNYSIASKDIVSTLTLKFKH